MRDQDRIAEIVQTLRGCMADIAFSDDIHIDVATNKAARIYHATADADGVVESLNTQSTALLALVQQWRELDSEIANGFADQLERLITGEGK